jgi:hypothetical protein
LISWLVNRPGVRRPALLRQPTYCGQGGAGGEEGAGLGAAAAPRERRLAAGGACLGELEHGALTVGTGRDGDDVLHVGGTWSGGGLRERGA